MRYVPLNYVCLKMLSFKVYEGLSSWILLCYSAKLLKGMMYTQKQSYGENNLAKNTVGTNKQCTIYVDRL